MHELNFTLHNLADSVPTCNLVRINEASILNYRSHDLQHGGFPITDINDHFELIIMSVNSIEMEKQRINLSVQIIRDGTVKSAEHDQTACMCRLISLYTFCKINPWSQTARGWKMAYIENTYIVLPYIKISNEFGRIDNFLALARKLSFLPNDFGIFDIRQHYVLGEKIIISPNRLRYFFIYGNTMYVFYLSFSVSFIEFYYF